MSKVKVCLYEYYGDYGYKEGYTTDPDHYKWEDGKVIEVDEALIANMNEYRRLAEESSRLFFQEAKRIERHRCEYNLLRHTDSRNGKHNALLKFGWKEVSLSLYENNGAFSTMVEEYRQQYVPWEPKLPPSF